MGAALTNTSGWAVLNNEPILLTERGPEGPRWVPAWSGEGPLPGHRLFVLSSRGGSLCYKALIPFMRVPPSEAETTFPS